MRYAGDNYSREGKYDDSFNSYFIGSEGTKLKFEYHNQTQTDFDTGIMEVTFSNEKNNCWLNHKSVCYDHRKNETTIFHGRRATQEEIDLFEFNQITDNQTKADVIQKCIEIFERDVADYIKKNKE